MQQPGESFSGDRPVALVPVIRRGDELPNPAA